MASILSEEKFLSEYDKILQKYQLLSEKTDHDNRWGKIGTLLQKMKKCYKANKLFAAKILGHFEKYQPLFKEEERAMVVQCVELMKKLMWEKKLNTDKR